VGEATGSAQHGGASTADPAVTNPAAEGIPHEPDYRFTLANERTFLAWIRTSLALLASGVAVGNLVPTFGTEALRKTAAIALALLAVLAAVTSVVRWQRVQAALDNDEPLPRARVAYVLAGLLTVLAVAAALIVLFGQGGRA